MKSLSSAGYRITLLCNQFIKNEGSKFEYCDIIRIKAIFKRPTLNKIFNFPFILNLRVVWYTISSYLKIKPAIVHVHDLPMMPFGLLLKLFFNTKLIFDMHENYPEALKAYDKGIIERSIKNYKAARLFEKAALKFSDLIFVVTLENQDRLIGEKIPSQKIKLVSNTVDPSFFKQYEQGGNSIKDSDELSLIYSGRVSKNRGLDTAIRAMENLRKNYDKVRLKIVGEGSYLDSLKVLANDLELSNSIDFIGWPGHKEIPNYIRSSTICIIPQPSNGHSDTTVPHKLFEFMLFDRPILTSDAKPLKRIIEETGCGETFKSNDPLSFAESVMKIINSEKNYGANGILAVKNYYNWSNDSKILLDSYNQLLDLNS
ncbi:MAG: glycosyltransferase family 4 protein [Melioribacteraceae bacterium]|nr:glycosyltransferase family 4 protein [Melioribacteraceae bacterium]